MLISELRHNLVPMGRIPQHSRLDATSPWPDEQPSIQQRLSPLLLARLLLATFNAGARLVDPPEDQRTILLDQRNRTRPLALRALVLQSTRPRRRLPPQRPHPLLGVCIPDPATRNLPDPSRRAGREHHHIAPAAKWPDDASVSAVINCSSVAQSGNANARGSSSSSSRRASCRRHPLTSTRLRSITSSCTA